MAVKRAHYLELADALEQRWSGLAPGVLVDSEHQLAAEFGVNRLTAREAVREVERRLIVRRVAGSGTFVAHRLDYRVSLGDAPSFRRSVSALGHEPGVHTQECRWSGRGGTREFLIQRTLTVDGLIASAALDRFPRPIADEIARIGVGDGSIVAALVRCGAAPHRSSVRVALQVPDADTAASLGYSGAPPPVWCLRSITTDGVNGPVVHHSISWMRPDMFSLTIEVGTGEPR